MRPLSPEEKIQRAGGKITVWKPRARPVGIEKARRQAEAIIRAFLTTIAAGLTPVHAMRVATGIGKTRMTAAAIADAIRQSPELAGLYLVPTHKLGAEIAEIFKTHGLDAVVFRGRHAADPDNPNATMCLDLEAVDTALELGETVSTSCCRGKDQDGAEVKCRFFDTCAYQKQKKGKPAVWIAAHEMLTHPEKAFSKVDFIIIDEGFYETMIVKPGNKGLTIAEIRQEPVAARVPEITLADLASLRSRLARGLERHAEPGGLLRTHFVAEGLTPDLCTAAIKEEWTLKPTASLWPGMPQEKRRTAKTAAKGVKTIRRRDALWRAVRELLNRDDHKRSGRAFIETVESEHGAVMVVKTRGLKAVTKALADKPTLLMDATLPDKSILELIYPAVKIVADIEATMPHATIHSALGTPTSASKLVGRAGRKPPEQPIRLIRRYVLQRWLEHGRQQTLVIMQKGAEERLKALGLPESIAVEHFNNIEGLDRYKDVRLLIVVGRTQPTPFDVENDAATISGVEPTPAKPAPNGSPWFDQATLNIVMKDGSTGPTVKVDRHPDPLAEAVRHQICEAQLVQAIGRARAVNRTEADPVDIDILADVTLPTIPADTALEWDEITPSKCVEMVYDGVVLTSTTDMVAVWPEVWANRESARNSTKEILADLEGVGLPTFPCNKSYYQGFFGRARYQPQGNGQKWRIAYFNPDVLPNIRSWLEERLGPLAGFEIVMPEPPESKVTVELQLQTPEPPRRVVFMWIATNTKALIEAVFVNGSYVETRVAVTRKMRPSIGAISTDPYPYHEG